MADKAKSAMKAPASQLSEVKKKKEPPPKPDMLIKGQAIAAQSGNNYVVDIQLGKGGFGEVYKVSTTAEPDKKFAMKVEPLKCKPGHETMLRLKIEIHVFDAIAASTTADKTHFVKMHDKGKTSDFKFYVMDIIWLSLKEVAEKICLNVLSPATLIKIGRQTLKGIDALHELGFLHRDIKAANYAVGLPPKEDIIYLLDFGIARPYKDEKGAVKLPRARVPFMGTPKYASIRSLENLEQCRKDDLEVWMYMMIELYDKDNLIWNKEPDRKKALLMKYEIQQLAMEYQRSRKLKIPKAYVTIIKYIKDMGYNDKGDFSFLDAALVSIAKTDNINMDTPLEWIGKKPKSPEKSKNEIKKMKPTKEPEKKDGNANSEKKPEWDSKIIFDPPKLLTFKLSPEKQMKEVVITNTHNLAVTFKIKTIRHEVFRIKPVFFIIEPNAKQTIQLYYAGDAAKPTVKDRFTVDMMVIPRDTPADILPCIWKDKQFSKELAQHKRRKVLKVLFDGELIPLIPSDKPSEKIEEEGSEKKGDTMKTGRKNESKKRRKPRRKRDDEDRDEVEVQIEALEDKLRRMKKRRGGSHERTKGETADDYWKDEDEDSEDSDDDYSDDDEEYRRRRRRGRKKRSREMTAQTRDYSDRSDRDDRDERDERDDRRGHRRRSAESRKRANKKTYEDDQPKSQIGQEIIEADEKKDRDRKRPKDEKPAEKGSKEKVNQPHDDGAYMVLDDANATFCKMETPQELKDKKDGDAKKDQKPTATKPAPEKKANEAAPVKK